MSAENGAGVELQAVESETPREQAVAGEGQRVEGGEPQQEFQENKRYRDAGLVTPAVSLAS